MVHVSQGDTTSIMWKILVAIHEVKGHQTMIVVIQNLLHTIVEENADINEHLNKLWPSPTGSMNLGLSIVSPSSDSHVWALWMIATLTGKRSFPNPLLLGTIPFGLQPLKQRKMKMGGKHTFPGTPIKLLQPPYMSQTASEVD
jgi:hypothetical protein